MDNLQETAPIQDGYDVQSFSNDKVSAVSCSITGRVRAANEDSCGYRKDTVNGDLFVVCDGMGGHVGGAVASRIAVDTIIDYLSSQKFDDVAGAMRNALELANRAILDRTVREPSLKGMGTTACILLVKDGKARIAHIGDSRIYLFASDTGVLHRVTKDHSYVQRMVDEGMLDDRMAETDKNRNIILKALGVKPSLVFDMGDVVEHPLEPLAGDVFMICSDGLCGMLNDDQMESILRLDEDLDWKLRRLLSDANAEGKGTDNITVQLINILHSDVQGRKFIDYDPAWRREKTVVQTLETPAYRPKRVPAWVWWLIAVLAAMLVSALVAFTVLAVKDKDTAEAGVETVDTMTGKPGFIEQFKNNKQIKSLNEEIEKYKQKSSRISKDIEKVKEEKNAAGQNKDLSKIQSDYAKILQQFESERKQVDSVLKVLEKRRDALNNGKSDDSSSEAVKKQPQKPEKPENTDTSFFHKLLHGLCRMKPEEKESAKK